MSELTNSLSYLPLLLCVGFYALGLLLQSKLRSDLCNPLLIAILLCILALPTLQMDYQTFAAGVQPLNMLLTPATICLALPLYRQWRYLQGNAAAILCAIAAGVLANLCCVYALSRAFGLTRELYLTLLPKSVTSAIGLGLSQELGGVPTLTVAAIIATGVLGNLFAKTFCKWFGLADPIAKGLAIGTSAHAIATAKALEMGEVEGAISSLSITVSGLLTVVGASVFAQLPY